MDIKVDPSIPLTDDLLLLAADSLDLFASQFIKDTVRRNVSTDDRYNLPPSCSLHLRHIPTQNEDIRRLDEQVGEKERVLKSSTAKIAQVDEHLLQIEAELDQLCMERKQKEMDNDDLTTDKEW